MKTAHLLIGLTLLCGGCTTAAPSDTSAAYGNALEDMFGGVPQAKSDRIAATLAGKALGSAENPVRANMPQGQRAYLSRLRCDNGRAPTFERQGSAGMSPYGMVVDAYAVVCAGSKPASSVIYIDMYHPAHIETAAPPGFGIVAP